MPDLNRLAILDDYQGVARSLGPWDRLPAGLRVEEWWTDPAGDFALSLSRPA